MKTTFLTIAIYLLLNLASPAYAVQPFSEKELHEMQVCETSEDCSKVVAGCCPCAQGGQEVAINSKFVKRVSERFSREACEGTICTAWYRCAETKEHVAICASSKCTIGPGIAK